MKSLPTASRSNAAGQAPPDYSGNKPLPEITETFVAAHPHGDPMNLAMPKDAALSVIRGGERQQAGGCLKVFDFLLVPEPAA